MSASSPSPVRADRTIRPGPRAVIVSAWLVPVMVLGQFAFLAVIPIALVLVGTLRNPRLRALRWWAAGLTAAYVVPVVLWVVGPDRAPSLSKDIHPVFAGLLVAAGVAVAIRYHTIRKR